MDHAKERDVLAGLSPQDFLAIGAGQLAYIRPFHQGDAALYSLHAADGTQLSILSSYEDAIAGARVNNLYPVTLH